jgi:p-aminobenzoyl-glutamate transporter AbgT
MEWLALVSGYSRSSLKSEYVDRWYEMNLSLIGVLFLVYVIGGLLLFLIAPRFVDFIDLKTNIYSDAPIVAYVVVIFIWVFLGGGVIFGMFITTLALNF